MNRLLLASILSVLSLPATADSLNKCVTADGKVEYRDYACDVGAVSAQKFTVRENVSGSGQDLATIRQRDAEFNRRQAEKRAAQDRSDQQQRVDAERRYREERAHLDRQEMVNAIRENNAANNNNNNNYNNGNYNNNNYYGPNDARNPPPKVVVVPVPAKPASSIPAQPRKPNQPNP